MPIYEWRADDGSVIEEFHPMDRARPLPETRRRDGKVYRRVWHTGAIQVENINCVSTSLPFLTDAQLADPKIPKACNYTKDPVTGLNMATFSSKRERAESAARTGCVVD